MNINKNTSIPMVASKEKESDKSNSNTQEKTNLPVSNVSEDVSNVKNITNSVIVPSSNTNLNNTNSKNSNISSSISAMLTPDLLNSIDLQSNLMNKNNSVASYSASNIQPGNKYSSNRNILRDPKGGSSNRVSLSSLDKRLASESIDYEPVFK
jgi:hypothetical protein